MTLQQEMGTRETPEYSLLLQKKKIERLPNRTNAILDTILGDSNKDLLKLLHNYINENTGSGIYLENLNTYIDAHIVDFDNQLVSIVGITSEKNIDNTSEVVEEETFDNLKKLTVDFELAEDQAKDSLSDAI